MPSIHCLPPIISFLMLLQGCQSPCYSLLIFYVIPEVVISLFISLSSYVNSTLFLTDANLECPRLSLSPIIFRMFPLNLLLFLLLLLSAVFLAAFCLMPFSADQLCPKFLATSAALLWRIFMLSSTFNTFLPDSIFSVTIRRIATGLHRPLFSFLGALWCDRY